MTSPGENAPLDPEAFLRLRKRRNKLAAHDQLIADLVQKGWTAYMIWRYLSEECQIGVSRTAVYKACVRLKEATVAPSGMASTLRGSGAGAPGTAGASQDAATSVQNSASTVPADGTINAVTHTEPQAEQTTPIGDPDQKAGPAGEVPAPPRNATDPTAPQKEHHVPDQTRTVGGSHGALVATPLPADGEIVRESHARAPNNEDQQGTFAPATAPTSSTMQTTDSSRTAIRPGIEKFDRSDWDHIKGVRAMKFRKSGGTGRSNTTEDS